MSVFKEFFQVSLVLMVILFSVNLFIDAFGQTMTGETIGLNESDLNVLVDTSGVGSTIEQTGTTPTANVVATANYTTMFNRFTNLVAGWQKVVYKIFDDADPSVTGAGDQVLGVGTALISLITMFQLLGLIYLPFAILATFLGGGSP